MMDFDDLYMYFSYGEIANVHMCMHACSADPEWDRPQKAEHNRSAYIQKRPKENIKRYVHNDGVLSASAFPSYKGQDTEHAKL